MSFSCRTLLKSLLLFHMTCYGWLECIENISTEKQTRPYDFDLDLTHDSQHEIYFFHSRSQLCVNIVYVLSVSENKGRKERNFF